VPDGPTLPQSRPDRQLGRCATAVGAVEDFGQTVEILAGLGPADWVMLNPADSLTEGASVRVLEATQNIVFK